MSTSRGRIGIALVAAIVLVACGGGGDDDGGSAEAPAFELPTPSTLSIVEYLADVRCADGVSRLGCLGETGSLLDDLAADGTPFSIAEFIADVDVELPEIEESTSVSAYADCLADGEGARLCVPRIRPSTICSPIPTDMAGALGFVTQSGVVRDGYRLIDNQSSTTEDAVDIAIDRFCDLLDRSDRQAARTNQADDLRLDDDVVRSWSDDLDRGIADVTRFADDFGDRPAIQLSQSQLDDLDRTIGQYLDDVRVRSVGITHCRVIKAYKIRLPVCG